MLNPFTNGARFTQTVHGPSPRVSPNRARKAYDRHVGSTALMMPVRPANDWVEEPNLDTHEFTEDPKAVNEFPALVHPSSVSL